METDLHAVIRANNILEEVHKQYVIYQILKCLKYMHSTELLHRDLKPSNILLNSECLAKVCDLGLARSIAMKEEGITPVLTEYVATRWYRAPEILLGSQKYTKGVDMWSLGCILGELLLGKPIFPGTSTLNQLDRILELTGRPIPEDIEAIQSSLAGTMLEALPQTKTKPLHEFFPTASDEALDLLKNLLQFNPNKRLTAEEALEHPYVSEFHNIDDEPSMDRVIEIAIDDNTKFSIREYRDKLYQEIMKKKKEQRKIILDNTFIPNVVYGSKAQPIRKEEEKLQKQSNNNNNNNTYNHPHNEQKYEKVNYGSVAKKPEKSTYSNNNAMTGNMLGGSHALSNSNASNNFNPNSQYNYLKQSSIKGKSVLSGNGIGYNQSNPIGSQMQKGNMIEKNYNFISGSNNTQAPVNKNHSAINKGGVVKEEKNEKYNMNSNPVKNVLNSGIVYRNNSNNNPSINNKKTFGKI